MKPLLYIALLLTSSVHAADSKLPDLTGTTAKGLRIEIFSELSPLRINQIHSWHVRILDSNEQPQIATNLEVSGGMPEHDHGLPTQPQITSRLDNGDYLLEGIRFHMQGLWQLHINLQHNGSDDQAVIDFNL